MALLELKDIDYSPEGVKVLKEVNVKIEKGSVTGFLGNPGSGKSTALKMIAGILIPSYGHVLFNEKDVHNLSRQENLDYRKQCGFMFQDSALFQNQDIFHNLALPLQMHFPDKSENFRKEKVKDVAELVGYSKSLSLRPASLSIGEQKIIGFARAIICNPDILFLDEPTESLDEKSCLLLTELLQKLAEDGKTIVFVSHDINFVNSFNCNKVYFKHGEVVDKKSLSEESLWSN